MSLTREQLQCLRDAARATLQRVSFGWRPKDARNHYSGIRVNSLLRKGLLVQIGTGDDGRPSVVGASATGLAELQRREARS